MLPCNCHDATLTMNVNHTHTTAVSEYHLTLFFAKLINQLYTISIPPNPAGLI